MKTALEIATAEMADDPGAAYDVILAQHRDYLPPLLIERCKEWHVNPAVFNLQAGFDRILIAQIHDLDVERTEDGQWKPKGSSGLVTLPERALERQKNESPRGIIISAGLQALEQLNTNGMEIGDYVRLLRLVPYRLPVGLNKDMTRQYVIVGDVGSIVADEDTMDLIRDGKLKRAWTTKTLPNGDKWYGYCYEGVLSSGRPVPDAPPISATAEELT